MSRIEELARLYRKLHQQMVAIGIQPDGHSIGGTMIETHGECVPLGTRVLEQTEITVEDYTAYDRGDLCSELDRALGDLIERTMHRYMPREEAKAERHNSINNFADKVIARDKAHGKIT